MSGLIGKLIKGGLGFGVVMGLGYAIMSGTTPSEDQLYNKLSPELKRQVDYQRNQARQQAERQEQLQRLRESQDSDAIQWATSTKQPGLR